MKPSSIERAEIFFRATLYPLANPLNLNRIKFKFLTVYNTFGGLKERCMFTANGISVLSAVIKYTYIYIYDM